MYYTYVLISKKNGQLYIGLSKNVNRRLAEHNKGYVKPTKGFRPYELIATRKFENRVDARRFEKKLKQGYLREYLKKMTRGGAVW